MHKIRFLTDYLKQQRMGIVVFLLFCLVFLSAFALYHLPVGAILYPALVCTLLGLLFLLWNVRRTYRKHQSLQAIRQLSASLMKAFPSADTLEETDYQQIIQLLREEQRQLEDRMNVRYMDMMDYYTIWAHQIKTPIASMRLNLQNEDTALAETLSEDLFRIEQYVEMVLCYLRLDSRSTDYVIREFELDAIIRQAVQKLASQFIRRKIHLDYQPLNTRVLTDEKWLAFVLEQVLSNALKYTPSEPPAFSGRITIGIEEPGILCIRDNGIGIAPEDLPRIFDKGYTGYNGRSNKKASGIGLYLCWRICSNLGHSLTANSSLDSGTVIRIHLEQKRLKVE